MKAKNSWAWLTWTVIVNAKFPAFQGSLDFCSGFLGFPGVSMSCFSMKARNFHTWHSHSCLSWLFWIRFVWTKSTLSAKAQSPLLAFQAFLGRTFRSFQESQEFPCFPGFSTLFSTLSQRQKSREKPRKTGSPGFSGVSVLFLAFFGKGQNTQHKVQLNCGTCSTETKIALMVLRINNPCLLSFQTFSMLSRRSHICKKIYINKYNAQAAVPGKPISVNRGLNLANPGWKCILRLDSVPESTINTNQVINEGLNLIHLARSINSPIGAKTWWKQTKWRS